MSVDPEQLQQLSEKLDRLLGRANGSDLHIFDAEEVAEIKRAIAFHGALMDENVSVETLAAMVKIFNRLDGALWVGGRAVFVVGVIGVLIVNYERILDFLGGGK